MDKNLDEKILFYACEELASRLLWKSASMDTLSEAEQAIRISEATDKLYQIAQLPFELLEPELQISLELVTQATHFLNEFQALPMLEEKIYDWYEFNLFLLLGLARPNTILERSGAAYPFIEELRKGYTVMKSDSDASD